MRRYVFCPETSKKGNDSTFTVEFSKELTDEKKAEKLEMPNDLSGVKVLLAEDNALNAEIAQVQLEKNGIQVTWLRTENRQ